MRKLSIPVAFMRKASFPVAFVVAASTPHRLQLPGRLGAQPTPRGRRPAAAAPRRDAADQPPARPATPESRPSRSAA